MTCLRYRLLLGIEGLVLTGIVLAFWHHSPPIRDQWVGLLWLALPFFGIRLLVFRRLASFTPLLLPILLIVPLTAFNYQTAPYARTDYLVLVCRPISGIWLVIWAGEVARAWHIRPLLAGTTIAGLILGLLALTATQWDAKSDPLLPIINLLPDVSYRNIMPDMLLSFNPNEIAGAIAWILPLLAGIALANVARVMRWLACIGAVGLGLALFLGQSRFAIGGVLVGLTLLLIPLRPRWRLVGVAGLAFVVLVQAALLLSPASGSDGGAPGLSSRDQLTFNTRFELWERGFRMMADYPLTGAGMSMYRTAVLTDRYRIPVYDRLPAGPPHAHNEWAQIAADLGLPGLILFAWMHLAAAWMLWRTWRTTPDLRALVLAVTAGLVAHGVYGVGDAITLWDRYAFLFWWMFALVNALYLRARWR